LFVEDWYCPPYLVELVFGLPLGKGCQPLCYSFCIIFYTTLYNLLTVWTIVLSQKPMHYYY